MDHSE
jgi:hypothetical protein